jgi:hypothetical protein
MADLSFAEVSVTSRNAMLATKVCKVIRQARKGNQLSRADQGVLVRGADLLTGVVQGSLLIEKRHLEERSHRADLKVYRHAISALELLQQAVTDEDVTSIFQGYRDELVALSKGSGLEEARLSGLDKFFRLLSDFFSKDFQRIPRSSSAEPVLSLLA